ncbi:MAG: nitrous oxide reductase family maturation protein NosD [Magnetococcales bacterium]|nr:nitrous oxide reductase family maturation protein NosD [Magnetococcales bacterium]NGZ25630.1 nitrous oxide reductase family maturation protein NosD [Magnetococcales bacterium]
MLLIMLVTGWSHAWSATLEVPVGEGTLAKALASASSGDTLRLLPGIYRGNVVIGTPAITLEGQPESIVQGEGSGSVILVEADHVTLRGLTVQGSGIVESDLDAGIHLTKTASQPVVEKNRIINNMFGIVVQGAAQALVQDNIIRNRNDLRMNERGNALQVWNTSGSRFLRNDVKGGRDGIYIHSAHGNTIIGNRFIDLRFAVHYMYANNNEVSDNLSMNNSVGLALMYSDNLKVFRNVSINDREHGLMFHSSHRSEVAENVVKKTQEKCTFIYLSTRNILRNNHFEGCGIGIHFSGGAERNTIFGNAFINNQNQVKYSGTVYYEWSQDKRGNYWSDNAAFDLNGDGVADTAYRPNNLVDRVIWSYPLAKLLLSSPVMETLRYAQNQFPALYPGGVVDSWPLMAPPLAHRQGPETSHP